MKQYFIIETKKGVSRFLVMNALRELLGKKVTNVTELKSDPHSLASLGNFVSNRK